MVIYSRKYRCNAYINCIEYALSMIYKACVLRFDLRLVEIPQQDAYLVS